MIPFSPFKMRLPPSGPTIEGTANGQILVWDATQGGWVLQTPASVTEFDYILRSRADLVAVVAPVGGVFELPAGSYFIKTSFALNAGEGLLISDATRISGGGPDKVLSGSGADPALALIEVDGGELLLDSCDLDTTGGVAGVLVTSGEATIAQMDVVGDGTALRVAGGQCRTLRSRFRSTGANAVEVTDGVWTTTADHIACGSDANGTLLVNGANAYVFASGTDFESEEGNPVFNIAIDLAACVMLDGGRVRGHNTGPGIADGVLFRGDVPRFQAVGVEFEELLACLAYQAGIMFTVAIQDCTSIACVRGVNWPAISVPSQGLIETGNKFNMVEANTFIGHVATDANVMRRANSASPGLLAETPLIP